MCERRRDLAGIYSGLWQYLCEMCYWYVWHDSFIHARDGSCDAAGTYKGVWHDSFIRVTWLTDMCDMSHPCDVARTCSGVWYDFFYKCDMTFWYVTWLIDLCEVTYLYVWAIGVVMLHEHVRFPPDPISHVCSLTGKWIGGKYFTYHSVQIFKIMFWRFLFSRIWSSAQDHALLVLLLNLVGFFISTWQNLSAGNDFYWRCTSFGKAFRRGRPLNIIHDS